MSYRIQNQTNTHTTITRLKTRNLAKEKKIMRRFSPDLSFQSKSNLCTRPPDLRFPDFPNFKVCLSCLFLDPITAVVLHFLCPHNEQQMWSIRNFTAQVTSSFYHLGPENECVLSYSYPSPFSLKSIYQLIFLSQVYEIPPISTPHSKQTFCRTLLLIFTLVQ